MSKCTVVNSSYDDQLLQTIFIFTVCYLKCISHDYIKIFHACLGVTARDFILRDVVRGEAVVGTSMYDRLRSRLATILDRPVENVEIFTVRDVEKDNWWDTSKVDVMYAAHGSPYYRPSKLNGLVLQRKDEVSLLYLSFLD